MEMSVCVFIIHQSMDDSIACLSLLMTKRGGKSFPLLSCTAPPQDLTLGSRFPLHSLKQHLEQGGKII